MKTTAKEYLHSDEISEWDTIFDPPKKCEYTEEQLISFAERWADIKVLEVLNNLDVSVQAARLGILGHINEQS
tara:strand:+ start:3972 stop:4190 length:219 start_codon:yes stop_codon:yes gene_type:complete